MNTRSSGLLALSLFTIVAALHFFHLEHWITLPDKVLITSRWLLIISLVLFAWFKKSLTTWIFVAMTIGVEIGLDFPAFSQHLRFLSTIFLRLVKTIVAPLLFATLVVGIASHSNLKQVGRMGWKSILYFEIVTTFALLIGLLFINITKAGVGIEVPTALLKELPVAVEKTWQDHIVDIFPENIIKSIYEGNVLPIVVFSVLFGIALAKLAPNRKKPMLEFSESLAETMFRFVHIIMYFAPFGVGAAISVTVGHLGLDILKNLALLLMTLYLALFVFFLFILFSVLLIIKVPVRKFILAIY